MANFNYIYHTWILWVRERCPLVPDFTTKEGPLIKTTQFMGSKSWIPHRKFIENSLKTPTRLVMSWRRGTHSAQTLGSQPPFRTWCFILDDKIPTRWAPSSYKWRYNPYKWPYEWLPVLIALVIGVINPVITGRGPTLYLKKMGKTPPNRTKTLLAGWTTQGIFYDHTCIRLRKRFLVQLGVRHFLLSELRDPGILPVRPEPMFVKWG